MSKYSQEQLDYVIERIGNDGDSTNLADRCVWCLQDTAFGSGKYVNRIPVFADADTTDWYYHLNPAQHTALNSVEGYGCEECYDDEPADNITGFTCSECGASGEPKAKDCCDECLLKFYSEDINAPSLNEIDRR